MHGVSVGAEKLVAPAGKPAVPADKLVEPTSKLEGSSGCSLSGSCREVEELPCLVSGVGFLLISQSWYTGQQCLGPNGEWIWQKSTSDLTVLSNLSSGWSFPIFCNWEACDNSLFPLLFLNRLLGFSPPVSGAQWIWSVLTIHEFMQPPGMWGSIPLSFVWGSSQN